MSFRSGTKYCSDEFPYKHQHLKPFKRPFKVVEKRPQRQLAFSEIDREAFRRELTESEIERRREAWIQGLKEKAQIERIGKLSVRPPSPTHP